ncbi:putative MYH7B protein [Trypanosoma grayi]|uniref:putative MYH7B protein n=1 Tax=Trypanosoma grayi TaxID=71804 RepID=UPI0004F40B62|nr:putative MYH7B protein [Trypanosoma grayi]KEG12262.1 putative MYH7B protein [Trypanosoma grayi]
MEHLFKKHLPSGSSQDQDELEMLRQKNKTLEEAIKRTENELEEEKLKLSRLQEKTASWKEKVKQLTAKDRARIAELEEEITLMKTISETAGVPMTAELQSLVDRSLAAVREEHVRQQTLKQDELTKALASLSQRDAELEKSRCELEGLKNQYIENQQRFTQELEALSAHHERELKQLQDRLGGPDKIRALEQQIQKQTEEIQALEEHSTHQKVLAGEFQKELMGLKLENDALHNKLKEAQQASSAMHGKLIGEEGITNEENTGKKTTDNSHQEHQQRPQEEDAVTGMHPLLGEKLQRWKEKVKQEKLKDVANIRTLTQELQQLKEQSTAAQNIIHKIATHLKEAPPDINHCIHVAEEYWRGSHGNTEHLDRVFTPDKHTEQAVDAQNDHNTHSIDSTIRALTNKLDTAVQEREEVQRELERTTEELSTLREQHGTSTVELQVQLDTAVQEREGVLQECKRLQDRCAEVERECHSVVKEKEGELRMLEEKIVVWKEKVKATKAKDDARIESLEGVAASRSDDVEKLKSCLVLMLAVAAAASTDYDASLVCTVSSDRGEGDIALLLKKADDFRLTLTEVIRPLAEREGINSVVELLTAMDGKVSALQVDLDELQKELQRCQKELEEALGRLHEAEQNVSLSAPPNVVAELELRNSQLEEKCELLRKEIKRQREAFQREKGQQDLSVASPPTRTTGGAALRAASGGVFEKDMLSLATQQSQRDNEMRHLRAQLLAMEKENVEMKRECEHNNSVIAQYTKDIELLKAKERVQLSVEYVRNVILQFLCCSNEEVRMQMVPAIATVLEFTAKEKMDVQSANPACPRFH